MNDDLDSAQSKNIWNEIAEWWDGNVQDGDLFHKTFIYPSILKLAQLREDNRVLDIACGNGALTRLLAQSKAEIVATDFSEKLIHCAMERSEQYKNIKFLVVDATDQHALRQLSQQGRFDVVICSMAFQDMWTIEPLISSLKHLIASEGRFIFSIPHPCFNSGLVKFNLGTSESKSTIAMSDYASSQKFKIQAKPNQPASHLAFHRSLSTIFNLLFQENFVMNGFLEPVAGEAELPQEFLWSHFKDVPPAIISRWVF
jgi:2-polyprenyl-3-methyl-5-hydroxy-6-metoxy-1,4-benzoquinol methylase